MFALPVPDYESIPRFRSLLDEIDDRTRAEALDLFLPQFRKRYLKELVSPKVDYSVRIGAGDDVLRDLQQDGCALTRIDTADKARLVEITAPLVADLDARQTASPAPTFKHGQLRLDREAHAAIFEHVDHMFSTGPVYAVSSAYAGRPLTLAAMAIQVNDERTTALKYGALGADGLPALKTSYYHIDSGAWPPLKVLIYLNRVTPDEGPFRYVIGSHRLTEVFELAVRKTNDKIKIPTKLFLALPPPFRLYTDFGDYMDPDSAAAAALQGREREICDGESDLILFDYNGVHRGGFVRRGHRYMLQCAFDPKA